MGVADEVGGDDVVLGVAEDALEGALGRCLDLGLDLVVLGGLAEAARQVDDGHVGSGDAERHAGQLAVEGRDDLAHGLGGSGGGGDDVLGSAAAITPGLGTKHRTKITK